MKFSIVKIIIAVGSIGLILSLINGNETHIVITIGILLVTLGVKMLIYLNDNLMISSKNKDNTHKIIFAFAFPKALLIGLMFTGTSLFVIHKIILSLFNVYNFSDLFLMLFFLFGAVLFLILGLLPLTSFNKLIIDKKNNMIHSCTALFNIFKDRKPSSFQNFKTIKLKAADRKGSSEGLGHSRIVYSEEQIDLVLISNSKSKNLLIKNIGTKEKAIKIGNIISSASELPFIHS